MIPLRPEFPEVQNHQIGELRLQARLPAKQSAQRGSLSEDRHKAADQMKEALAIGQANQTHRMNNRAGQHRRRAKERALSYQMERAAWNPMENAKRFVRR